MRAENRIIKSINRGYYHKHKGIVEGVLGTWAPQIYDNMILKDELLSTIVNIIDQANPNKVRYVSKYLDSIIPEIPDSGLPPWEKQAFINSINDGLSNGLDPFYQIARTLKFEGSKIFEKVKNSYESYEEEQDISDELPF